MIVWLLIATGAASTSSILPIFLTELKTIETEVMQRAEELKNVTSDMDGVRTKLSEKRKTMNEAKSKVDEVKARLRKRKAVRTLTEFYNINVKHNYLRYLSTHP